MMTKGNMNQRLSGIGPLMAIRTFLRIVTMIKKTKTNNNFVYDVKHHMHVFSFSAVLKNNLVWYLEIGLAIIFSGKNT